MYAKGGICIQLCQSCKVAQAQLSVQRIMIPREVELLQYFQKRKKRRNKGNILCELQALTAVWFIIPTAHILRVWQKGLQD